MKQSWLRLPVLATITVLMVACAGTTTTPAPSTAPASQAAATVAPASHAATVVPATTAPQSAVPSTEASGAPPTEEASTGPEPSTTPIPTPVIITPESVAPGVKVIRWYCCLGTGDAPEQVAVEKKVIDDFNAAHSDIQISGEFVLYAQAFDTLATEIAGGNPPTSLGRSASAAPTRSPAIGSISSR